MLCEMGEAKGVEIRELSSQSNGYHPRDFLQRFTATNNQQLKIEKEENEEIELNLGLSLGGRFGVDPKETSNNNKLVRSSSIAGITTFLREDDGAAPPPAVYPLVRTSSLPMESEDEWRKRKELQSLRRLEAKRKRSEKQRNTRLVKDRGSLESNCEEKRVDEEGLGLINLNKKIDGSSTNIPGLIGNTNGVGANQQQFVLANGFSTSVTQPFGVPNWPNARGPVLDSPQNVKGNVMAAIAGQGFIPPSSQGSVGSHGSSSSGISEFESLPVQGLGNCLEEGSPASVQSVPEQNELKPDIAPPSTETKTAMSIKVEVENPSKKAKVIDNGIRETGMKVMEEMPCVSTKGDGPNGRRIEGFLYRYKKGEEVRIVCVCHGSFLTPAEFVKHAGGGDVEHPLRHIVVSPSSNFL
ncbi:hypothetical protein IFM89_011732 [Coptis chinensis]|uniref:Ninja-family protein n=1 Tax=Coptis chinensis TaxID=261450 RepID=A0A835IWH5_9MAGN|nr:hypothetical protein IFM89_011732 [Coptis chinensis]